MKIKQKLLIPILSIPALFLSFSTIASAFFCPTGFQQIYQGDTIDRVIQQCGKPDNQKKLKSTAADDNLSQEWVYSKAVLGQGSLRMNILFSQKKVINLTVNGMNVTNTNLCGPTIALNDDMAKIKSTCGEPSLINKNQQNTTQEAPPNPDDEKDLKKGTVEFFYNSSPPVTLIFVDGFLQGKK